MIHLDHHPSPLSPHSNPNLILPGDQVNALFSSSHISRDEQPFYSDPHDFLTSLPDTEFDVNTTFPDILVNEDEGVEADGVLEQGAESVTEAPASPVVEEGPSSPNVQRSSSLSPPPDSALIQPTELMEDSTQVEEGTHKNQADATTEEPEVDVQAASRHSTPLSELSPAPEQEEPAIQEKSDKANGEEGQAQQDEERMTIDMEGSEEAEAGSSEVEAKAEAAPSKLTLADEPLPAAAAPDISGSPPGSPAADADQKPAEPMVTDPVITSTTATHTSKSPVAADVKPPTSALTPSHGSRPPSQQPSEAKSSPAIPPPPSNNKAERLLELNSELFKVCMEFQAHGIPMQESRFNEYATRLQANLTWLASHADGSNQGLPATLPVMEAPSPVDFVSMERINLLYADLPTLFANDIARRQQMGISPKASTAGPGPFPGTPSLKRDRPEDTQANIANKRRDTGESKSPPLRPTADNTSFSLTPPTSANFLSSSNGLASVGNMPQQGQMAMPSIAPPSLLSQGMPTSNTEAQAAAAARDRARRQQIEAAIQSQQRNPQQQPHQHNNSQMPLPSGQNIAQMPAPMAPPGQQNQSGHPQHQQQQPGMEFNSPQAIAAFGPNVKQNLAALQQPGHAFVAYMNKSMPGFAAMQVPAQLRQMFVIQQAMKNQQQQGGQQGGQQSGMPNMQTQPNMQGAQSNGMRNQQYPAQASGPTSPTNSVGSNQNHPGQQPFNMSNGSFGPGPSQMNHTAGNPNAHPMRNAGSVNLNNLTPEQRQQFMAMQQMRLGGGGNGNPSMISTEAYGMPQDRMRLDHQRMSQAGSPSNAGSPPMSAPGQEVFPALRSNPGMPGISRSTRSPSGGPQSPMPPQMQRGASQGDMRHVMGAGSGSMGGQMPGGYNQNSLANWQPKNQQSAMPMSHLQSPSYGVQPTNSYGGGNNQNWPQQYPMAALSNVGGYQPDGMQPSRQSSSTPAPQIHSSAGSPNAQHAIPSEFDMLNWNGQ